MVALVHEINHEAAIVQLLTFDEIHIMVHQLWRFDIPLDQQPRYI